MKKIFNIFGFQIGWWACVIGVKNDFNYFGPIVMLVFILLHLSLITRNKNDYLLIPIGIFFGILVDGLFKNFGLVQYLGNSSLYLPPLWIIAMWAGFCLTINHSLAWLKGNMVLSFLLGFIFGPLSYLAGQKMGVIIFNFDIFTLFVLAFAWGICIPILYWINSKINNNNYQDYSSICITIFITITIARLCSTENVIFFGVPILVLFVLISFIIHWLSFIPAYFFKTEKYYDITGTISYLFIFTFTYFITSFIHLGSPVYLRSKIILILVTIWAIRLGIFLLIRVFNVGEDRRFREVKVSFTKFLLWFTVSGAWVFFTTCNALTIVLINSPLINDIFFKIGLFMWISGFIMEVLADEQKRRFKKDLNNKDQFISTGLWRISRHPNYFGEILQWVAIAVISLPILNGWEYLTLISPFFVSILLTKVSGINLLEKSSDEKWGNFDSYIAYKNNTPILIPFINKNK